MDRIYAQSQLCIIAAAGASSNYGLPGVGHRARTPQTRMSIGNINLVQQYFPSSMVLQSTWRSRGWTFQEGCLARRQLIFTDEEVIFLCREMCKQESLFLDNTSDWEGERDGYEEQLLREVIPSLTKQDMHRADYTDISIQNLLAEYTRRQLSFDTDAINAFQGIFQALSVRHCWGMPFEHLPDEDETTIALDWKSLQGGERRESFPSWSWAGSRGESLFRKPSADSSICKIELSLAYGTWLTVKDYIESHTLHHDNKLGKLLRVTGCTSRPHFVDGRRLRKDLSRVPPLLEHEDGTQTFAILKRSDNAGYWIYKIYMDLKPVRSEQLTHELSNSMTMLVCRERGWNEGSHIILSPAGGHFRRIGLAVRFHELTFTEKDLRWKLGGHKFLRRTDDEFKSSGMKRTIILE